ncbi:MAG: hypothetical protein JWQ12_417 [Glaciihabitans sp.]|nr:hypothetical protein [Glaciihabitans sp.]
MSNGRSRLPQVLAIIVILAGAAAAAFQYTQLTTLQSQAASLQGSIDSIVQKKAAAAAHAATVKAQVTAACTEIGFANRAKIAGAIDSLSKKVDVAEIKAGMNTTCPDSAWAVDNIVATRLAIAKSITSSTCVPAGSTGTASGTVKNPADRGLHVEFTVAFGAASNAKEAPAGSSAVVLGEVPTGKAIAWHTTAQLGTYVPDTCRISNVVVWPSASSPTSN